MTKDYLVFGLDQKEYAVQLQYVQKVSQIVEIAPIPRGPKSIIGLINVHGQITPVVNLRYLLGLAEKPFRLNDQLIIIQSSQTPLAIIVDHVSDIIPAHQENSLELEAIIPKTDLFETVIKENEHFILCLNPDALLSPNDLDYFNQNVKDEHDKIEFRIAAS